MAQSKPPIFFNGEPMAIARGGITSQPICLGTQRLLTRIEGARGLVSRGLVSRRLSLALVYGASDRRKSLSAKGRFPLKD